MWPENSLVNSSALYKIHAYKIVNVTVNQEDGLRTTYTYPQDYIRTTEVYLACHANVDHVYFHSP